MHNVYTNLYNNTHYIKLIFVFIYMECYDMSIKSDILGMAFHKTLLQLGLN